MRPRPSTFWRASTSSSSRPRNVVVIEHDLDVAAHADWFIDMGPGAGHDGGTVVFTGTPAELAAHPTSHSGRHLASNLGPD